jgi:hypothetical protein
MSSAPMSMILKICSQCSETKPPSLFGRFRQCKECINAYKRSMYPKYRREIIKNVTEWASAHPERVREHTKRWAASNPERHKMYKRAHARVAYALRTGKMTRPNTCERCQSAGPIEAAHFDYSRPLEVKWLCRPCHRNWDRTNPKTKQQ